MDRGPRARPLLLAAAYQHAIATGGDTPPFDAPFPNTGLPDPTELAEACKLRPPQPPRNRPRRGRTGPDR
ncbi:hypothetical protein [Kitasatospora aureofaciens]|uniref:hypothetical protein n=1 Tax=Kitasatospora aureofaciens TaxID=1894 RepID=UPI0037F273A7